MPESGRRRDQGTHAPDRRTRRHEETRSQILDLAVAIMTEDGVAGLSMASLARALSIQPPSLYKYFPSRMAVYDALFRQGQLANLEALRSGMRGAVPGMDAVAAGMEAAGRWAVSHPVLAQLLFWRPVPGFQPTADAFAPALEIIDQLRHALRDAGRGRPGSSRRRLRPGHGAALDPAFRDAQPAPGQRHRQRLGPRPVHPAAPPAHRHVHPRVPARRPVSPDDHRDVMLARCACARLSRSAVPAA